MVSKCHYGCIAEYTKFGFFLTAEKCLPDFQLLLPLFAGFLSVPMSCGNTM
jgi:hypothetical protein